MKPLPCHTPIVQSRLPLKYDIETSLEQLHIPHIHDHIVRLLKESVATTGNFKLPRDLVLEKERCDNDFHAVMKYVAESSDFQDIAPAIDPKILPLDPVLI